MIVYIMRGLPGSGKSTVAQCLVDGFLSLGLSGAVYSTDNYRYDKDGVYRFNPDESERLHQLNFEAFCRGLGYHRILVVDNTNIRHWEYQRYVDAAKEAGYLVQILTAGSPKDPEHVKLCAERNLHGVPLEAIQRMSERFEV